MHVEQGAATYAQRRRETPWIARSSVQVINFAPERAKPALARMTEWILANARMLEIVCGFGFGAVFAFKGLTALLG
jgi:hypothetical protein